MVESGLVDRIEVSQYRLTAHLALALVIYAATLWAALGLTAQPRGSGAGPPALRRGAELVLGLVGLTIVAGGFVAGLNAGLVYNTFPLMGGRLVPADYAQLHPLLRNWFENAAAVQFDHRLLAMTTVAAIGGLWLAFRRRALPRPARSALDALALVALLQLSLGIATLLLVVPILLAAAHQAGAVLVLTAALVLRHRLRGGGDHPAG
jgi:cytochrome c oxidase assembly protein subunit 15